MGLMEEFDSFAFSEDHVFPRMQRDVLVESSCFKTDVSTDVQTWKKRNVEVASAHLVENFLAATRTRTGE